MRWLGIGWNETNVAQNKPKKINNKVNVNVNVKANNGNVDYKSETYQNNTTKDCYSKTQFTYLSPSHHHDHTYSKTTNNKSSSFSSSPLVINNLSRIIIITLLIFSLVVSQGCLSSAAPHSGTLSRNTIRNSILNPHENCPNGYKIGHLGGCRKIIHIGGTHRHRHEPMEHRRKR